MWPGDPGPGRLADPMPPSVTCPPAVESNEAGGIFLFSKDPFSALLSVSFDAKERSFDIIMNHYFVFRVGSVSSSNINKDSDP